MGSGFYVEAVAEASRGGKWSISDPSTKGCEMANQTTATATDALSLLRTDHREVEDLFERYLGMVNGSPKMKRDLVRQMTRELSVHSAIEEQFFYPYIRDNVQGGKQLVGEALHEHHEAKEILAELERMEPKDAGFDERVRKLIRDMRHHVNEEESQLFPKVRAAATHDQIMEMGRLLADAKKAAPTHPHPHAPDTPPANLVAGPAAGAMDRARDKASGGRGKALALAALAAGGAWVARKVMGGQEPPPPPRRFRRR
jgi:hemerythrin superfamily protein